MEYVKTIELSFAQMHITSSDVLVFSPYPSLNKLNSTQLEEIYQTALVLTENKPMPLYVDTIKKLNLSDKNKNYIVEKLSQIITACAIKEESLMVRFVVHAFNTLYRPTTPIKIFNSEKEAMTWLKKF